jgi:hypothetical protein
MTNLGSESLGFNPIPQQIALNQHQQQRYNVPEAL